MVNKNKIKELTREFLIAIGENPDRLGLKNTPERVANMCNEMFSSLDGTDENLMTTFFEEKSEENTITVSNLPVFSVCEHHLLPFFGDATIKYIPRNGKILGLSKFARIVNFFARKLQIQENLTLEIVDYLWENLNPIGLEVTLDCVHTCMTVRGVKAMNSSTKTTIKRGEI